MPTCKRFLAKGVVLLIAMQQPKMMTNILDTCAVRDVVLKTRGVDFVQEYRSKLVRILFRATKLLMFTESLLFHQFCIIEDFEQRKRTS